MIIMDFSSKICPHRTSPLIQPRYNTKTVFKMNKIIVYGRVSQSVLQEGRKFLEKSHSYNDIDLKTCKANSQNNNQKENRLPRYSVCWAKSLKHSDRHHSLDISKTAASPILEKNRSNYFKATHLSIIIYFELKLKCQLCIGVTFQYWLWVWFSLGVVYQMHWKLVAQHDTTEFNVSLFNRCCLHCWL